MIISIDGKIYPPILLGLLLGVIPAILLYQAAVATPNADYEALNGIVVPGQGDA